MKFKYGQFDGQSFVGPDALFPQPKVMEFILQYGEKALDAMENLDGPEEEQYVEQLIEAGLLERDEASGKLKLTPRMVRGLEHHALLEIFGDLRSGSREGHQTIASGRSDERSDGLKPYEFGDKLSEVDLGATMRNVLLRHQPQLARGNATFPWSILPGDFELHQTEGQSDVALCILLDMSGSMMRYGRFYQAKRVALGMQGLMRSRFPQDTVDFVGFYSLADRLLESQLPLVMPKPVSIYDSQVRLRLPLEQARAQPNRIPQHFTNLQMGLRVARQTLSRRGAANKMIFIITDGQPTAHVEAGEGGEMLYLLYPPSERTSTITLKEALRCQQQGISLATFALVEDYWGMDWVGFVDHMTRLTRGIAFYCSSDNLSSTVIESYLSGKRRKSFVH